MRRKNAIFTKLFANQKTNSYVNSPATGIPDAEGEPMKIRINSKGSVDIWYKRKRAKFYGELGLSGFEAVAGSMRWMEPVKDAPVSEKEREEWVNAIKKHPENSRARVFFVEDKAADIERAEKYWNNKEYIKAGELFEKHFECLSKAQHRKLEYIKKHYPGRS